ncbi:MAG: hypothetical protein ACD_41C00091G0008 [uncultured bacterium]|nr:MAG: hypothetical protein ACD_41C00091G0008 [uncultured bacterium]HBY73433.1 aldehyde dehydrogenase [Candidatus Kerfeldbacteria bacterium]
MAYPKTVSHWINNQAVMGASGATFDKVNPATGAVFANVARGNAADVDAAIQAAQRAYPLWSQTNIVERAEKLRAVAQLIQQRISEIAEIVHLETGKAVADAEGEAKAAMEMGFFVAGEGRRFYGKTTTSAMPNRTAMTVRQPLGVCGLIIAANTPLPNVAWKAFPALLCGNTVVLKPSEDIPYTAIWFAELIKEVGVPAGVFNVVQGFGTEVGAPLVADTRVPLISFTGSVTVGKQINKVAGERLAKVCLELGGKNPFVVCDDADLETAADFAVQSAFSNAGQRCAAGSRIIVFASVYDQFKKFFVERAQQFEAGPVINERQLNNMSTAVDQAVQAGATVLLGGQRLVDTAHAKGFYYAPTILENVKSTDAISCEEVFGPITILYKVKDFQEALDLANDTEFALTAAIHTSSIHRIQEFQDKCVAGVISVNGPSHGSEPHLPFGGEKNSGTGWREAGTEALDVYSDWKTIYIKHLPDHV